MQQTILWRNYVGTNLTGGTYQKSVIPVEMWSHHFDTAFGLPRTTDAVEAWYRNFNAIVGCHHPNIFMDLGPPSAKLLKLMSKLW